MSKYLHCMDTDHHSSIVRTICDSFCLICFSARLSFYKGKRTLEQAGQEERPPPGTVALHPQLLQGSRRPEHSDGGSDTTAQLAGDELQQARRILACQPCKAYVAGCQGPSRLAWVKKCPSPGDGGLCHRVSAQRLTEF